MGLLGRLKLQLRSSQFHKRRRLNGNRFAVAPAFEGLEVRSLLSGTAIDGLVFNKVDQVQINHWQVNEGARVVNGTAHFFGTDVTTGHAKAVEFSVNPDGTFGDTLDYLDWASVYEEQNPGADSYSGAGGFYLDADGNRVYVLEGASSADKTSYEAYLAKGNQLTLISSRPGSQTKVLGVANNGVIALGDSLQIGLVYSESGGLINLTGITGEVRNAKGIALNGNLIGGYFYQDNAEDNSQLFGSDGEKVTTINIEDGWSLQTIERIESTSTGLVGTSIAFDPNGELVDVIVNFVSEGDGYRVVPQPTQAFTRGSLRDILAVQGKALFIVDDPAVPNDATLRIVGSTSSVTIADLIGQSGYTDLEVNEMTLDESGRYILMQGYGHTASGTQSWVASLSVDPEVPAKPVPNFQNIPFKNGVESLVSWDAVDGAASYVVQINNLTTRTVERKVTVSVPELPVTLADAGSYAIWVQAVGATGKASPWSDATRFTVVPRPPAISYDTDTFRWTDIGASQYDLWVNNQSGQRVVNQQTSATSFTASLPPGTYTAWVKPDAQAWSTPYRFVVYHNAIAVDPLTTLDETPVITWAGAANGNYDVFVSLKGQSAEVFRQTVTVNSVELPAMARGVYTVWARQLFADGSFSSWGTGATLDIADRPVLSLTGSTLSWTSHVAAANYELWVSTDTTTGRIAVDPTFVSGTSLDLSSLTGLSSGNFRVWVRAVSDGSAGLFETSRWGLSKSFSV